MGSLAFGWPFLPGKSEELARLSQEVLERGDAEHAVKSMHGLSRMKVFHQTGKHELAIVYYEADDIEAAMAEQLRTDHEHEDWLRSRLEEILDFADIHHHEGVRSTLVFDWHREHGPTLAEQG